MTKISSISRGNSFLQIAYRLYLIIKNIYCAYLQSTYIILVPHGKTQFQHPFPEKNLFPLYIWLDITALI